VLSVGGAAADPFFDPHGAYAIGVDAVSPLHIGGPSFAHHSSHQHRRRTRHRQIHRSDAEPVSERQGAKEIIFGHALQ
jgi:hypothetical protein